MCLVAARWPGCRLNISFVAPVTDVVPRTETLVPRYSDVLPELDLGIQNAIRKAYRKRKRPTPKDVKRIGAKWSPHRSVASWYLWRSLENGDGQLGTD